MLYNLLLQISVIKKNIYFNMLSFIPVTHSGRYRFKTQPPRDRNIKNHIDILF